MLGQNNPILAGSGGILPTEILNLSGLNRAFGSKFGYFPRILRIEVSFRFRFKIQIQEGLLTNVQEYIHVTQIVC